MTRCILCGKFIWNYIIEGSLEVNLSTTWTDQKAEVGRVREEKRREEKRREEKKKKKIRKQKTENGKQKTENRKSQKKEDAGARKGRQVAKHCVFSNVLWLQRVEKYRLAKARGAEPSGEMRDEKMPAVVARSTYPSQNAQNITKHTRFGALLEVEMLERFAARSISKAKCTKHTILGSLLEVEVLKKRTPFWREAHFEGKMYKTHHSRSTFGRSDVVSRGRRKGFCTSPKVSKT